MTTPQKEIDIPVYVIPKVGRAYQDVIPDIVPTQTRYQEVDNVKDYSNYLEKNNINIQLTYKYFLWNKVIKSPGGIDDFKEYFSGLCSIICTTETKTSVANHFSLWDAYAKANIKDPEKKFIVVLEDENKLHDLITIHRCIKSMLEKEIDIIQLREVFTNSNARVLLNQENNDSIYSYTGGYDFSLSAYIIRLSSAIKIIEDIKKIKGVSTSLSFEMYRLEKELNINRQVINDAIKYVSYDTRYLSNKRVDEMRNGLWNRLGKWMSNRFPDMSYILTHPLFSFFGLFDITVIGVVIILFIILMLIFDVNSKLLWFLSGIGFTYIV
uniref:Fusion protein n=2 Tax=Swinepox virus TaxID=10276 RepID=A0A3G2M162_SWPV